MRINMIFTRDAAKILVFVSILLLLFLSSLYSYLLFHTLIEMFTIVIACAVFVLAWNFRRFYKNSFLTFIGTAFLFCSLIDLLHTMAYKGMGIFPSYDANLATQLWVAARYMQSISLLAAALFLKRRVKMEWLIGGFTVATTLLLLSIFVWNIFPTCYVEGFGLTPFKIYSEYVIDLILFSSILVLWHNRHLLDRKVLQWITIAIGLMMASELAFTFYVSVYGLSNLVGHIFRLIAYFLVYRAVIETEAGKIYADMTQLRATESALRLSELQAQRSLAELRSVYAHTPVGLCFYDTELRYQAINDMLADINGLPASEHIGKRLHEILPAEIVEPIEQALYHVLETGQPVLNQELSGSPVSAPNQTRQWLVSYHPAFEQNGKMLGVSCVVQDVTEQRQAEQALQTSESNLKLFIEYAPTAIAMLDREMRYIAVSHRYLIDYRIKEKEIIGRSHYEIFPEIPESLKEIHRRCLAGAIEKADEDPFPRADGTLDWVRWEIHPWYGTQGEIGGIIIFSEVVTERKRVEAALNESEKLLRTLGDHLPEGVIYRYIQDCEENPRFEYMSAGIEGIAGIPVAEVLKNASALLKTILVEDYDRLRIEEARSSKHLTPFEMEVRQRNCMTGEIHWSLLRSLPSRRPDGSTVWDGIQLDITERKRAEQALKESEKRFRSVVESNMIGVVFANPDTGELADANDEYLRIIGRSREQLLAGEINWRAITPPEVLEQEEQARHRLPPGRRRSPYEKEYLRPDGTRAPVIIGGSYLDDECHEVVAFVLDNTERKRTENELVQAHRALEDYAKKLRSSNKELEQFAFVASHDLQEPLRKIKMFGNLLQNQISEVFSDGNADKARSSLHRMENAADRMQKMIDGLLELSRVNIREGNFEVVQLKRVVEDVVDDLEARLHATNGQVMVGELYSAEVDVLQIRQLFQNLIGNALKFHKPGIPPLVEISNTVTNSSTAPYITISVKDNGIGFDEQYAEQIFRPFQRLHGRNEYEGSGLGLSICQKIVERHQGKIEAHSQPGAGATFMVTLPCKQTG